MPTDIPAAPLPAASGRTSLLGTLATASFLVLMTLFGASNDPNSATASRGRWIPNSDLTEPFATAHVERHHV